MKTSIILTVILALLFTTIPPRKVEAQVAQGVLIIACVVIASCIIIRVMRDPPDVVDRVLVLDRDHYDGNWTPVVTNFHAILYSNHPISVFADQITEGAGARYRVRDITDEWRREHPNYAPNEIQLANGAISL